jgi:uncharacterized membrane protein
MNPQSFLNRLDHDRVVAAIREAEDRSRGEIRVHVARKAVEDPQRAAAALFEKLGMAVTADRNGVLLFVAPATQRFAVVGDKGIHEKCGEGFWKDVAAAMEEDFRQGRFTDGIVKGVAKAGDALAAHFPRTGGADVNELPDEVSED